MNDFAWQFSESLAGAVEKAAAGVVSIRGRRRRVPSSGILWSEGVVVTAHHVLEWDEDIEIGLPDGTSTTASVTGRDPSTDLAALRLAVPAVTAPAATEWAEAGEVKAGHLIVGLSRPGRKARARLGIVGGVDEAWRTPMGGRIDADLHTDLPIHHGYSGSALMDLKGRVLGVNTAGIYRATPVVVPTATVRRVMESLLSHGSVRRGYLGISTQPVRLPALIAERIGQGTALLVTSVQPGSPADRAGLVLGDAITAFEGTPLRHPGELLPLLEEERIGKEATLSVLRAGEIREIRVTVGTRNGGGDEG
ncbi:MAG TPA: trypsin-like peptidase domain-containing protein [Thermoanaerobaculia bacterium]|jgi:S1-C subfamily serine protease|nr:trypsin-like peptidase domain-containing protein [Thermoanaerobaculia bacterium]